MSAGTCSSSAGIPANAWMMVASVAFEAEIMGPRRRLPAMPPLADEGNRSLRLMMTRTSRHRKAP
jgi:hypothetical protein